MNNRVGALWSGWLGQLVRFGLIGALNTAFSYALYSAGLALGLAAPLAWAVGFILGMALSLALNSRWTFRQKEPLRGQQVVIFIAVNAVSLAISTAIVALLTTRFTWNSQLAGIAAIPPSMLTNFIGNRLFVYPAEPTPPPTAEGPH
ncbi:hypothetical protein FACS1894184_03930 [Clostridia bacterium]|nr:hypothetical protein FACS1894184_03930 [Clostridia bacterium]